MHKAQYFKKLEDGKVECELCPHACVMSDGKAGICRCRKNIGGTLYATNYAQTVSLALDPIEKKPLYHFYPGSNILSIGANGCNLACSFCQNWQIAQSESPTKNLSPQDAVAIAKEYGSIGIAYTYSEPLIWYEYIIDTAKLAHANGLKNVLVSNGYINEEPLKQLLPLIDAINIDLKSINDDFYKKECKGSLEPVQKCISLASPQTHLEVTNLVIPGLNNSETDFQRLAEWLSSVDTNIPLHLSAYHPSYKCKAPPTPDSTLLKALDIVTKTMNYVYLGNTRLQEGRDTICKSCGKVVVSRKRFSVTEVHAENGTCSYCNSDIPIIK